MNVNRITSSLLLASLLSIASCEKKSDPAPTSSSTTPPATRSNSPAADNTARNKSDGTNETKTPLDQSQAGIDVRVTADIRRAIMTDSNMSMNAQNCKIITDKSGLVTLRGPVNSQSEKDAIEAKAKAIAGVTKVDNQLEVKPN